MGTAPPHTHLEVPQGPVNLASWSGQRSSLLDSHLQGAGLYFQVLGVFLSGNPFRVSKANFIPISHNPNLTPTGLLRPSVYCSPEGS